MLPLLRRKKEKNISNNKPEGLNLKIEEVPDNLFLSFPAENKRKKVLIKIGSYIGFPVILVSLVFAAVSLSSSDASLCSNEISFSSLTATASEEACPSNLFAEPAKNIVRESLDISLIQENSLVAVATPDIITPKTLGIFIGEDIEEEREGIIEYTVGPDDSISSIAEKFNISIETILWANNLSSKSKVSAGEKLVILPVSGVMYFVEEGDTLEEIAKEYKGDTKKIVAFNELKGEEDIYIGDVLVIPDGKIVPKASKPQIKQVPLADAYFLIPVEGIISQGLHFYNAIDIANSCGKPIIAAAGGKVQRSGWISSVGGNVITILHPNGVVTYYGHLSAMTVVSGQTVAAGQIIGYIGRTGYATGCHLHFDVRGAKNFMSRYPLGSRVSWK